MDFDLLFAYFRESLDSANEGPTDFNLAIANAVIWACALDEALMEQLGTHYVARRDGDRDGRVLDGLRLARNAILHGQTFGLNNGNPYPSEDDPAFYGPPVWKSYDELTRAWTPRGAQGATHLRLRATYEHDIAGTNIGAPLWAAREWLQTLAERGWTL